MIDSLQGIPLGADTAGLPKPVIRLILSGNSFDNHTVDIKVGKGSTFRTVVSGLTFGDWELKTVEYTVNFKDIAAATGTAPSHLRVQIIPQSGSGTVLRPRVGDGTIPRLCKISRPARSRGIC